MVPKSNHQDEDIEMDELPSDSEYKKDVEKVKQNQNQGQKLWSSGRNTQSFIPNDKNYDDSENSDDQDDDDDEDYGMEKQNDISDHDDQES